MSDSEFWKSTPAKIFALLDYHSSIENPKKEEKEAPQMTPQMFQQFGGKIKYGN